jgi:signal transduction histidine kinase
VFGRFYRARNVVGRIAGTGVGLAAVRHTVERHGGTIEVNSHEGRGTTFTIRLPLVSSVGTFVSPDRASRL